MIIEPYKYIFLGSKTDIDEFFARAQKKGFIEFIDPHARKKEVPPEVHDITLAIKILKKKELHSSEIDQSILPVSIAKRIIHAYETVENLHEKQRILKSEISRIQIFGDFNIEDIQYLEEEGKRILQYFSLKSSKRKDVDLPKEMIYVGTDYDLDYFVAINKEKKTYSKFIEMHIDKPVGILKAHLSAVGQEIHKLEEDLKKYSAYFDYLHVGLKKRLNDFHLDAAKHQISLEMGESLFSISGWVPSNKLEELQKLLNEFTIHAQRVDIELTDRQPTYMENEGYGAIGEDLVHVYDTPAVTDKDPSLWVMWAFSLFYAIIVADAGYGLLYLLGALFLMWRFPHWTGTLKRMRTLLFTISIFAIGWGALTASFFGIEMGLDNPFRKVSMIHRLAVKKAEYHMAHQDETYKEWVREFPAVKKADNGHEFIVKAVKIQGGKKEYPALKDFYDAILMEFALLIGVVHIIISFCRYLPRNYAGIGWIFAIIGGYIFFPSILGSTSLLSVIGLVPKSFAFVYGKYMLYGGIGLAVILAIIQQRLKGLTEIMNSIQIFSDILSYLRLYALGLAGMIMADTFNQIGMSIGLLYGGILIVLIGHTINITLGIMGGIIHGLRLNYIEWYHYSFEGGGRRFNPLRLLK